MATSYQLATTSTEYRRLAALREEIRGRPRRAEAAGSVRVSAPHSRTCYLSLMRLSGPRADVLDYAAYLLADDAVSPHPKRGALELEAVEQDDGAEITVLLSRSLYAEE